MMNIKKVCGLSLAALCMFSMLTGCQNSTTETVATDGSTSMEKVIGSLKESYESDHPGVTITYNPTGSGSG